MADPTAADQVRCIIADHLALDNPPLDDATIASLRADSLDALEIVMTLEERFEIAITDEEAEEAVTVAKCIALVERKLTAPAETEVLVMAAAQDARTVLRLMERERKLTAQLAETREHLRPHARRPCDAAGFSMLLNGPALERLAVERSAGAGRVV